MRRLLPALLLVLIAPAAQARLDGGTPVALVTAETLDQLVAVELPSGRVLRRLHVADDPQNVDSGPTVAVVVSARGAAVTLVDVRRLRILKVFHGFGSPHVPLVAADGRHAYVTDDARGQLVVLDLARRRVVRRLFVGLGAHHMTADEAGNRLWVALGERARSLVRLDVSNPTRPRIVGHVDPHGAAHDLAFTPDDRRVWATYDDRPYVAVFSAATGRLLRWIRAGSPPQHVAFDAFSPGRHAYVTSGDDATLRILSLRTGRLVRLVHTSYGSFNVATSGGFVATSSLYTGALMDFRDDGRRLLSRRIAPTARDLAVAVP